MKFLKKGNTDIKNFWVENYTETDKQFLEKIGFIEYKRQINGEIIYQSMNYTGSGFFGFWSDDESEMIYKSIQNYLGVKKIRVEIATLN